MPNAIELTISDVRTFKTCRKKWDYSSTLRQGIVPKSRAVHFAFGDLFHQALEQYYNGNDPVQFFADNANDLLEAADLTNVEHFNTLTEALRMGPAILQAYVRWAADNDDFKVIASEQRNTVRLSDVTPGNFFSFKFDMLIERSSGLWIMDFKTDKNLPTAGDWLAIDDQAVSYQWAVSKALGRPIVGFIFTYIRKKEPTQPKLLKNGRMSTDGRLITTVDTVLDTLAEYGLDPKGYRDYIDSVAANEGSNFFARFAVRASQNQRELIGQQLVRLAQIMSADDVDIYPSPDRMKCSWCDYKVPCELWLNGLDDQIHISQFYEKAEPRP